MIQITVLYPDVDFPCLDTKIGELIQRFGGSELGSGAGFGQRDIAAIFTDLSQPTHSFIAACLDLPGCELRIVKDQGDRLTSACPVPVFG
ncbi:hypothetical protein NDA01_03600 [Trichocoleus desertorum AS-A10]|uniref:hypothetical protein n=1 Tax=Trichocoleus desertorum TaxID=1481672 RepID=UPI00329882C1